MHHRKNNCNFGLYFVIWDRILGTMHSDYEHDYNMFQQNLDMGDNVSE